MNFGERKLFEAITKFSFVLIDELPKLAASVGTEAIEMATISESKGVCFTTRNSHDFLVAQSLDLGWVWLVGLILGVLR